MVLSQKMSSGSVGMFCVQWSDRIGELGETDSVQNVNVRILGGTDMINSVGPMC